MCLEAVASKEELKAWKAKKGKYVKVYKVCANNIWNDGKWETPVFRCYFETGTNKARSKHNGIHSSSGGRYACGFHSFKTSLGASNWKAGGQVIVIAYVPVKDICAMGKQKGYMVLVSRRIFMPEYPKTVAKRPK